MLPTALLVIIVQNFLHFGGFLHESLHVRVWYSVFCIFPSEVKRLGHELTVHPYLVAKLRKGDTVHPPCICHNNMHRDIYILHLILFKIVAHIS